MSVINTSNMVGAYVGSDQVLALAMGSEMIWSSGPAPTPTPVYSAMPLTIEALENGDFYIMTSQVDYSLDGGDTWETTTGATTINLSEGDTIQLKKSNIYLSNGNILTGNSAITFNVYGNAMSLIYGDNYIGQTSLNGITNAFSGLFKDTSVVDASNLILPTTEIDVANAYYRMFYNCYNLTTAPELPATTLYSRCYEQMFKNCYNLTTAPELPAPTLVTSCYKEMFRMTNAKPNLNLNYLKCLATDISASDCLSNWVQWVTPPTGTFVKDANTIWPSGNNGIPTGWTVVEV